nr:hypothetical protein [Tanacetum cinerariifolium]
MHKAFPLLIRKFPLPEGTSHYLKKNATARRKVLPLLEVCTTIIVKEKLRTKIAQSLVLLPVADEPASPFGSVSQGEAYPIDSGFEANQDRANIAKTSNLPSDSTPRVTSLAADEGSIQHKLNELTALCTSLQRQQSCCRLQIHLIGWSWMIKEH